jgi:hypothetical protein
VTSRRGRPKPSRQGARGERPAAGRSSAGTEAIGPEAGTAFPADRAVSTSLAALLIVGFVLQCLLSSAQQSATYDEPVYIAAGYSYVETADFRLKRDAPPLVATLSGLALRIGTYFGNAVSFDTRSRLWSGPTEYRFAEEFLAAAGDRHRTVQIARLPVVLLGAALAAYVFLFGRLLWGGYAALVPLFLFCVDPNMIAHARVVSNDAALAAFFFITHYYFYRLLTEDRRSNLVGVGVAAALTIVAKFSGLLIVPSLALLGGLVYLFPRLLPVSPHHGTVRAQRRRILRIGAVAAATCAAATVLAISVLYRSPSGVEQYVAGVRSIYTNAAPGFQYYLLGDFSPSSAWYYYPIAMLLKTPDVTIVLLSLAIVSACVPGSKVLRGTWMLVPVGLVLAVSSQDPANLGLRRVLLVYPFLFLWIGERGVRMWELIARSAHGQLAARLAPIGLLLVALTGIASAVRIHPYQLAHFNSFAGGPAAGHRYLDDSNIDWGQDLPGLAAWQSEHGVRPLALWYFGTDNPTSYGIDWRPLSDEELLQPRRAAYAISVNFLIALELRARESRHAEFDWLARYRPAATIGHSIHIYDFR